MRNTANKNLSVLVLVALFTGWVLTLSLTLASCELLDLVGFDKSEKGSNDFDDYSDTTYTIVFSANGGNGNPPNPKIVYSGYSLVVPGGTGLSRRGFTFGGWNTNSSGSGINYPGGSYLTPNTSLTLYARWIRGTVTVPGDDITHVTGLASKLDWLQANARSGGTYILELNANENAGFWELYFYNRNNITVIIRGVGSNRTLSSSSNGILFDVERGVTLILDSNITLRGRGNNAPLIHVRGGTLEMNSGSAITNNNYRGVEVDSGGTFTMNGGIISGNKVNGDGGGVAVWNGSFTMNGGTISGNTASCGGGVYINNGYFTMNGGTISGNKASDVGGGVQVDRGTFIMHGGTISSNTAFDLGGGVAVTASTFSKMGGIITGYRTDPVNGNQSLNSRFGHAVYAYGNYLGLVKSRETTAGRNVNLFYSRDGSFGGDWGD